MSEDDRDGEAGDGRAAGLRAVSERNVERFAATWLRTLFTEDMVGVGNVDILIGRMSPGTATPVGVQRAGVASSQS